MLAVGGHGKQPHELVAVENPRQGGRRLGTRHIEVRVGQTERDAVQEADAVANAVAALPGQPLLFVQMEEVVLDFRSGDPVGAATIVAREPGNRVEVRLLGVLGESANGHVVGHALAQLCHGCLPLGLIGHENTPMLSLAGEAVDDHLSMREKRGSGLAPAGRAARSAQLAWCREITTNNPAGKTPRPRNAAQFYHPYVQAGLDDNRYVVERYKSTFDGEIVRWPGEGKSKTGKQPSQVVSLGAVQRMRPERDEIIVCTGVKIAGSGIQYWGS